MALLLLTHQKEENDLLDKIKEHADMLAFIKDTLARLAKSFEVINQVYSKLNADLVSIISDLNNKTHAAPILKPAEVDPPKKVRRSVKKRATITYRRICNLCHPDKLKHKDFSEDATIQLISLYQEAQKANKTKDLPALQIILSKAMAVYRTKSIELEEKFKDCLDKADLIEESEAILAELSARKSELDTVVESTLFKVLTHHNSGEYALANMMYRNLLIMNINALQTNFKNRSI